MKFALIFPLFAFLIVTTVNSQDLMKSRTGSYYKYYYRLTNEEAEKIIKHGMQKVDEEFFHTLVDSMEADSSGVPRLQAGNYLEVKSLTNNLVFRLQQINSVFIDIADNERDLLIALSDSSGDEIKDAIVRIDGKKVEFDQELNLYRDEKSNVKGILSIEKYKGVKTFYKIERSRNNPAILRISKDFVWSVPVKYIYYPLRLALFLPYDLYKTIKFRRGTGLFYYIGKPFADIYHSILYMNPTGWVGRAACIFDPYYCERYYPLYGFSVTNKPQYRPGDTLMLKSRVVNKRGRPVSKKAVLRMPDKNGKWKIVDTITPYRKGSYKTKIVLHDSLKLRQSSKVYYYLETRRGRELQSGDFFYEDYELKSLNLSLNAEKDNHYRGMTQVVRIDLKDENELRIPDGRYSVDILTDFVSDFQNDRIIIPDTLWKKSGLINPAETTEIPVPDSIFPAANLTYKIHVRVNTSSNETAGKTISANFFHRHSGFRYNEQKDSCLISYLVNGKSQSKWALVQSFGKNHIKQDEKEIHLPASIRISPHVFNYLVSDSFHNTVIPVSGMDDGVNLQCSRNQDSLFVYIQNRRKLDVHYFIYRKDRLIREGTGNDDNIIKTLKTNTKKNYRVVLNYYWGDEFKKQVQTPAFYDKNLNVNIFQSPKVYPGQESRLRIQVKDAGGNPVKDAEITSWGITDKFDYSPPSPPYFGKRYPERAALNSFSVVNPGSFTKNCFIDYQTWGPRWELDSIEYYKFLFPEKGYQVSESHTGSSYAEVAPFVVEDGKFVPVYLVYIDNSPVYFRRANHIKNYSFKVRPGIHDIRIRTKNKHLFFRDVELKNGVKTFISIDPSVNNKRYTVRKAKERYTKREQLLLNSYLIKIEGDFSDNYPYLKQNEEVLLLSNYTFSPYEIIAGPLKSNMFEFHQPGHYHTESFFEKGFLYEFEPYGTKMYGTKNKRAHFSRKMYPKKEMYSLHDRVLTEEKINEMYRKSKEKNKIYHFPSYPYGTEPGKGTIFILPEEGKESENIRQSAGYSILMNMNNAYDLRVGKNLMTSFHNLSEGRYNFLVLTKDSGYYEVKNLKVSPDHFSCAKIHKSSFQQKPDFYKRMMGILDTILTTTYTSAQIEEIQTQYYDQVYFEPEDYLNGISVSGVVTDTEGTTLPGVSISIRGTSRGTVSDINGNFSLMAPKNSVLQVNYIGFSTVFIRPEPQLNIILEEDVLALEEVVVIGYGINKKKNLSSTVSVTEALQGRLSGVSVLGASGNTDHITIRGISSIEGDNAPLYVVNGIPVSSLSEAGVTKEMIDKIQVIKDASAVSVYGSRAAHGVVIINTKPGVSLPRLKQFNDQLQMDANPGGNIRSNFSDYAFWQPSILTDEKGIAEVPVKYPDDLTRWNTYAIAVKGRKYTGSAESGTRSFLPVSGRLEMNRFLIEGDSSNIIGKTTNYQGDSISGKTFFRIGNTIKAEKDVRLKNIHVDTFMVSPGSEDSLEVSYAFSKDDGFLDGEKRKIPVFPVGTIESKGLFLSLIKDTSFIFRPDEKNGQITIHARTGILDVLLDEIERVKNYPYYCNEQAASKLIMLIHEKQICEIQNKKFKNEEEIKNLIRKLKTNQNKEGLWGWWPGGQSSSWITIHVVKALLTARDAGFDISVNMNMVLDGLMEIYFNVPDKVKTEILKSMHSIDPGMNMDEYLYAINTSEFSNLQDTLDYYLLLQDLGQKSDLKFLWDKNQATIYGNFYWENSQRLPFSNNLMTTLKAYELIRNDSNYIDSLPYIRNYFLEERKTGCWRNTYESSEIVSTILPDYINENHSIAYPQLRFTGSVNQTVDEFPYSFTTNQSAPFEIEMKGKLPVYLGIYQQFRNRDPEAVSKDFDIRTWFSTGRDSLKAGEAVSLEVELVVKKDADYIMVEIPIPAACSYGQKDIRVAAGDHVEYYREKAVLFFSFRKAGSYRYSINLIPRYTGKYSLNPAKAELMYFPTDFGRNRIRKVQVE